MPPAGIRHFESELYTYIAHSTRLNVIYVVSAKHYPHPRTTHHNASLHFVPVANPHQEFHSFCPPQAALTFAQASAGCSTTHEPPTSPASQTIAQANCEARSRARERAFRTVASAMVCCAYARVYWRRCAVCLAASMRSKCAPLVCVCVYVCLTK